jgi:hypothetical protein
MSKIKNFDRAQYESDFDAIIAFAIEGILPNYNFNVVAGWAFENMLTYLCLNSIPHQYSVVKSWNFSLITLNFGDNVEYSYTFFSDYKEEDE